MTKVLICCPHCGYRKQTLKSKIPPTAKQVRCPQCEQTFLISDEINEAKGEQEQLSAMAGAASTPAANNDGPFSAREAVKEISNSLPRRVNFTFHGTGKEYFGIWIVNTLLKIVTLGLYSPWAKVRKRNYFYGCTQLEGMNFDYLANPIALLKGWLLAALLFILYSFGANFSPTLSMVIGLLIYLLMPWAIVRSRQFNNRNSAHRNIRFNFYPDYQGAYWVYLGLPTLVPLTLGLLTPYMIYRQKQFLVENNSFGKTNFRFFAASKDYYWLCARGAGVVILALVGSAALFGTLGPLLHGVGAQVGATAPLVAFLMPFGFILLYLFVATYFYVRITNLTWNNTRLGRHRFESRLKLLEMFWLFLSNGAAVMLSFGLLMPWATVRLTRYRLEKLTLIADGSLAEFEAFNRPEVSATGEEIGDIFGMDIGL